MNIKGILILFLIIAVSCNTSKQIANQKEKDRIETFENKNFKGKRIEDYSGIAITRSCFKDGKLVSVKYFDINDEPVRNKKSWDQQNAEWKFEYDKNGNFIKQTANDLNGELFDVEHWSNSAIEILEYNNKNQLIKKSNYNKKMKLVGLGDIGNAMTKYGYNEKGELIWKMSYDKNKEFIKNGFCYSKFEYNQDGTLDRLTYLYDEDKVNMVFKYTYKEGNLIKEESFDEEGKKIGYELFEYDKSRRLIQTKNWYHKWEKPSLHKEEISLELDGWKIKESSLESMNFIEADEGEYEIQVNHEGNILNITPVKYEGGTPQFNSEVYSNFKGIKLIKEQNNAQLNGILKVTILNQNIGILHDIARILKPRPYY